jgi:hypothetical protein
VLAGGTRRNLGPGTFVLPMKWNGLPFLAVPSHHGFCDEAHLDSL